MQSSPLPFSLENCLITSSGWCGEYCTGATTCGLCLYFPICPWNIQRLSFSICEMRTWTELSWDLPMRPPWDWEGSRRVLGLLNSNCGEGEGGMIWDNSVETCILSRWNRSPAQAGCMRQVLRAGALGRPRGMGWGGRWEGGSGWGTHVNPWLIHVNVWQNPLQYCKIISLQLIKINGKKKKWDY